MTTQRRWLPRLWADSKKVYLLGVLGVIATAIAVAMAILMLTKPTLGAPGWDGLIIFFLLICEVIALPLLAYVAYSMTENLRPVWRRIGLNALTMLTPIVLLSAQFSLTAVLVYFLPTFVGLAIWTAAFFLLCRDKPVQQVADRTSPFSKVTLRELRGGFSSIGSTRRTK